MDEILLSVVISTYNQAAYLPECIDSVINALTEVNAEIIITDDFSTDETRLICTLYAQRFPEIIRLNFSEKNNGGNVNYLRGHSLARGKFVSHIDGDDIVEINKFVKQLDQFFSEDVNLVIHSSLYFSDFEACVAKPGMLSERNYITNFSQEDFAAWGPISVHSSFMYRRSAMNLNGLTLPFMEWRVAMELLSSGRGIFINERLIRYRYNDDGVSWTSSSKGKSTAYQIQFDDAKLMFDKKISLRPHIYSQVLVNLFGILRSGADIPNEMVAWIIRFAYLFRPRIFVRSFRIRLKLRVRTHKSA